MDEAREKRISLDDFEVELLRELRQFRQKLLDNPGTVHLGYPTDMPAIPYHARGYLQAGYGWVAPEQPGGGMGAET